MGLYGVILCDLFQSRQLSTQARTQLAGQVRSAAEQLASRFPAVAGQAFEFRFGDEWQLLVTEPKQVYTIYSYLYHLLAPHRFYCGIGIGSLTTPVNANAHEMDGPAFHLAREALDWAKEEREMVVFRLPNHGRKQTVERVAQELANFVTMLREARLEKQVELAQLAMLAPASHKELAARLGVSRSNVTHRLKSARVREEQSAMEAIDNLLQWFLEEFRRDQGASGE